MYIKGINMDEVDNFELIVSIRLEGSQLNQYTKIESAYRVN